MEQINKETDNWSYLRQPSLSMQSAETLEKSFKKSSRFYHALLQKYLPLEKNTKILDLPCGEGRMVYALKVLGYQNIEGHDLDENRLATAKKLDLPVKKADVFEVLEKNNGNSIGCILSIDFLEHLEKSDVVHFLKLSYERIANGGMIIIRMPCADNPFGCRAVYNDFTHKWGATSGVLSQLLLAVGFNQIKVFGERPNLKMKLGLPRTILFNCSKFLGNLFLRTVGQGPLEIWSSSMWAVAWKELSRSGGADRRT